MKSLNTPLNTPLMKPCISLICFFNSHEIYPFYPYWSTQSFFQSGTHSLLTFPSSSSSSLLPEIKPPNPPFICFFSSTPHKAPKTTPRLSLPPPSSPPSSATTHHRNGERLSPLRWGGEENRSFIYLCSNLDLPFFYCYSL